MIALVIRAAVVSVSLSPGPVALAADGVSCAMEQQRAEDTKGTARNGFARWELERCERKARGEPEPKELFPPDTKSRSIYCSVRIHSYSAIVTCS